MRVASAGNNWMCTASMETEPPEEIAPYLTDAKEGLMMFDCGVNSPMLCCLAAATSSRPGTISNHNGHR
jgi:hypothetical protein